MKGKVYCEVLKEYTTPSSTDEKAVYLVRYGYVDWYRGNNKRLAVYTLIRYNSKIKYISPTHLLVEKDKNVCSDFSRVMKMRGLFMREFKLSDRTK